MRPDLLNIEKYMPTVNRIDQNAENTTEQYWKNLVNRNKEKEIEIKRLYDRIKIYETIRGILTLLSLAITEFEYESIYYDYFYTNSDPSKSIFVIYPGTYIRLGITLICFILIFLSLIINYSYYLLKKEQKKIINSKYKFINHQPHS